MRKILVILAFALTIPAAAAAWHFRPRTPPPVDHRQFRHDTTVGCTPGGELAAVIRNDGDGWYAIHDETHVPINVRAVVTTSQSVRVVYSFKATVVHTFSVSPDETLALAGISGGASVGLEDAEISIARLGKSGFERANAIEISTIRYWQSNFWISGRFTADCDT